MVSKLVELVPNVSEGRSAERVNQIASAFSPAGGSWLLDVHSDVSHHRSVLTAVARPESVLPACLELFERALSLIDLRRHDGEHPRIGAVDVLPLVPIGNLSREETIALARDVAREAARRFELPVFLYGLAATDTSRRELSALRRGGFEALGERMSSAELVPDYGPLVPHPTGGATAVGVRDFLIAYNVELATADRKVAAAIARRIRTSGGGVPAVKALGFALGDRGRAQVSMNLVDPRVTGLADAFDAVQREAERLSVGVVRSEIVGLIPEFAAFPGIEERLKLTAPVGILEDRIRSSGLPADMEGGA